MLSMNNINDKQKMMKYYRTSDMLNLLYFFPELSPIADLTIVEDEADYLEHRDYLDSLTENRVDTLKGRTPISGIENSGKSNCCQKQHSERNNRRRKNGKRKCAAGNSEISLRRSGSLSGS